MTSLWRCQQWRCWHCYMPESHQPRQVSLCVVMLYKQSGLITHVFKWYPVRAKSVSMCTARCRSLHTGKKPLARRLPPTWVITGTVVLQLAKLLQSSIEWRRCREARLYVCTAMYYVWVNDRTSRPTHEFMVSGTITDWTRETTVSKANNSYKRPEETGTQLERRNSSAAASDGQW